MGPCLMRRHEPVARHTGLGGHVNNVSIALNPPVVLNIVLLSSPFIKPPPLLGLPAIQSEALTSCFFLRAPGSHA